VVLFTGERLAMGRNDVMICPKCNTEMHEGYIPVSNMNLYWSPKNEEPALLRWGVPKGGVRLMRPEMFGFARKEAFFCQQCDIVLIDTIGCERKEPR